MKNKDCPYRFKCKGYAFDTCDGCNNDVIRTSINSNYGLSGDLLRYIDTDVVVEQSLYKKKKEPEYPKIKNVKISGPCTIIFWEDGTKTVMRCSKIDENHFDAEKAILLAFYRKVTGFSKTHTQKELDKLTNEAYDNIFIESVKE